MSNTYTDLVKQTFYFPQEGFDTKDGYLYFNDLDLKALIDKYGTPLKLTYLPKIGSRNINTRENIITAIAPRALTFLL
jgi:arginine decarboxylase